MPEQAPITGITVMQRYSVDHDFAEQAYPDAREAHIDSLGMLSLLGEDEAAEVLGITSRRSRPILATIVPGYWCSYTVDREPAPKKAAGEVTIKVNVDTVEAEREIERMNSLLPSSGPALVYVATDGTRIELDNVVTDLKSLPERERTLARSLLGLAQSRLAKSATPPSGSYLTLDTGERWVS